MRLLAQLMLIGWCAVLAAHVQIAMAGIPAADAAPAAIAAMTDCECPPAPNDTDKPLKDLSCIADAACIARCTFVQPALLGPMIATPDVVMAAPLARASAIDRSRRIEYPPERPPKPTFPS